MMKLVISGDGLLTMNIPKNRDKEKSRRLMNIMLEAKRDNRDITDSELNYISVGFKTAQNG